MLIKIIFWLLKKKIRAVIRPHNIEKSVQQMLLGVCIDKNVILKNDDLCPKAFWKLSTLCLKMPNISADMNCLIMKALL